MNNQINAKVRVYTVKENMTGGANPEKYSEDICAHPVYGDGTENASYSAATPSGKIELTITNKAAWGFFAEGQEYYVDFVPAK